MVRFSTSTFVSLLALASSSHAIHPLVGVLSGRPDLTMFVDLIRQYPEFAQSVATSGGTILAPSNTALAKWVEELGPPGLEGLSPDVIRGLLSYHVIPETIRQEELAVRGGDVAETSLRGSDVFANLGDKANAVFASAYGSTGFDGTEAGALRIYSGAGATSEVVDGNIAYDGGVVHVIDAVLTLPQNASASAQTGGFTSLLDALNRAGLAEAMDTTESVTICAPTNEAFASAGIDLANTPTEQLAEILKYHVAAGVVGYSPVLSEEQDVPVLTGQTVKVIKRDGKITVGDAQVVQGNIILSNGVLHLIDRVLLPNGTDSLPSGSNSAGGDGATGTTRRPGDSTGTAAGAEQSDDTTGGAARGLKASLFGLIGAVGASLIAAF